MRRDSFERFYLEKVALGEGCGCAEHVTRLREIDRQAASIGRAAPLTSPVPALLRVLRRIFARTGFYSESGRSSRISLPSVVERKP